MGPRAQQPIAGIKASERTGARLAASPRAVDASTWREIRFGLCRARAAPPPGFTFGGLDSQCLTVSYISVLVSLFTVEQL